MTAGSGICPGTDSWQLRLGLERAGLAVPRHHGPAHGSHRRTESDASGEVSCENGWGHTVERCFEQKFEKNSAWFFVESICKSRATRFSLTETENFNGEHTLPLASR
jgi:hypothetical protein